MLPTLGSGILSRARPFASLLQPTLLRPPQYPKPPFPRSLLLPPLSQRRTKRTGFNRFQQAVVNSKFNTAQKQVAMLKTPEDVKERTSTEVLIPSTFIPLAPDLQPKDWPEWLRYRLLALRCRLSSFLAIQHLTWSTRRSVTGKKHWMLSPSPLQLDTRMIPAVAKDLHERLNHAISAGDGALLAELCTLILETSLLRGRARPLPGEVRVWDLLEQHAAPELIAHSVTQLRPSMLHQQAVVRLDTTQRLRRYDAVTGELRATNTKRVRENIVLMRLHDSQTFARSQWRVWGYVDGTDLDAFRRKTEHMNQIGIEQAKQKHGL